MQKVKEKNWNDGVKFYLIERVFKLGAQLWVSARVILGDSMVIE